MGTEGKIGVGDHVTNEYLVAQVLAIHGQYAWVMPIARLPEKSGSKELRPLMTQDGPLTFEIDTLRKGKLRDAS